MADTEFKFPDEMEDDTGKPEDDLDIEVEATKSKEQH